MVPRPRDLVGELRGPDAVKTLRAIKNQVIGCKSRKVAFISEGAVQEILQILNSSAPEQQAAVAVQACAVLGSLAYGTDAGLRELVAHGGIPRLVAMLSSADPAVVEAGLRAIKMVVQQVCRLGPWG